jgi:hypothetical protein
MDVHVLRVLKPTLVAMRRDIVGSMWLRRQQIVQWRRTLLKEWLQLLSD